MLRAKRRPDGRYQTRIAIGNGKYKYITAHSQRELDQKVAEVKMQAGRGIDVSAERDTFGAWGEVWLKKKQLTVCDRTYLTCKARYKRFEPLYCIPIVKLRLIDFQDIFYNLASGDKPLSKKTLTGLKQDAIQIIQTAIDNRVLDYNCASAITIPNTAKPAEKRRALTKEEQRWIVDTPHRAQTAAMIMMFAGLRRGELLALTWNDIDLERKTINVNKSVEFKGNDPHVKSGGKTDAATRKVYIPDILVDYLKNAEKKEMLVCPSTKGKTMTEESWRRMWESYLKELNFRYGDFGNCIDENGKPVIVKSKYQPGGLPMVIPRITAHWLRHTFITNMYLAGVSLLTAKDQAGHADIRITSEIYTHLDAEYKARDMNELNNYFSEKMMINNSCISRL